MRKDYTVVQLCKVLGVSTSGYYAYIKRPKRPITKVEKEQLKRIKSVYNKHSGTYGAKRIAQVLKAKNTIINHKKVARLMRESNLKAKVRQKKTTHQTKQEAAGFVYENHLKRDFKANHPNQKWVTDLTEVEVDSVKLYISAIMDLFNGEVIAFEYSLSPNQLLIEKTIIAAQRKRKLATLENIIIHSDQGSVYRSVGYNLLSKRLKFIPSMSRKANCWDNAVIESFFSQLKTEFPHFYPTINLEQVQLDFIKYIRYYNEERIQKKMGYVSPKEYYKRYLHAV